VNMERPQGGRYPHYGIPTRWLEEGRPGEPDSSTSPAETAAPGRPRQAGGSSHNVRTYQAIGLVQKLLGGRVGLGVYALIPYSTFTGAAAFYSDEREQYFSNSLHPELYADRLTATSLAFGLGARLWPWLAVGGSFTLGLRTRAVTPTYLTDIGQFQNIRVDSDVKVNTALAPHFGAVVTPVPGTRLVATVHTPQKFEVATDFGFLVSNGLAQSASIGFTHSYLPWTFGLGGEHVVSSGASSGARLSFAALATYALWSQYLDRHSDRPAEAWSNTVSAVLGLRLRRGGARGFLDLTYVPTPVPDQAGRSNYVDSDRLGASLGWDYQLALTALGARLRLGLQAQAHHLLARQTLKRAPGTDDRGGPPVLDEVPDDAVESGQPLRGREGLQTNNPGWPGYAVSGWIVGAGVNLTLGF
jgi:long-chain fatty acid transport protein